MLFAMVSKHMVGKVQSQIRFSQQSLFQQLILQIATITTTITCIHIYVSVVPFAQTQQSERLSAEASQ